MPSADRTGGRGGTPPRPVYAPSAPTAAGVTPGVNPVIVRALEVLVGQFPNTQIEIITQRNSGVIIFLLNSPLFGNGVLAADLQSGFAQVFLNGPVLAAQGDFVGDVWNSAAAGGGANREFIYNDKSGTPHEYAFMDNSGFHVQAGSVVAVQPGTGTVASPAVAESWHPGALINSWAGSGAGGPNGLWYRLLPTNEVEIIAEILNTTATGNSVCFVLPSGYVPATSQNKPAGWNNPQVNNSATPPWVFISSSTGDVQVTGIEVANKSIFFHIFVALDSL